MTRLIRAELFKLRATNAWWALLAATLVSTVATLVVNCVNARALLKPFTQYVLSQTHDHTGKPPADFLARLRSEWLVGHDAVSQAATIYTSGQLIGLLLSCLLGVVLVTGEFYQQTATSTFLITPRRSHVIRAKLVAAVLVAAVAWLVSTVVCVAVGATFLHQQGYATQLASWGVTRALLLNLAAYVAWAIFGVGFGALVRNQLAATVSATVLYLVGATSAGSLFDLLHTYVLDKNWVLAAQVVVPPVASQIMVAPTKIFAESPPQWVGALVLLGYAVVFGVVGVRTLRRRDIA